VFVAEGFLAQKGREIYQATLFRVNSASQECSVCPGERPGRRLSEQGRGDSAGPLSDQAQHLADVAYLGWPGFELRRLAFKVSERAQARQHPESPDGPQADPGRASSCSVSEDLALTSPKWVLRGYEGIANSVIVTFPWGRQAIIITEGYDLNLRALP
jgi:hypothetical protein